MARWESATDAQLDYVRALVDRVRAQRDVVSGRTLDRGQASVVIDALLTIVGEPTNVVSIERAPSRRDDVDEPVVIDPVVPSAESVNEIYRRVFVTLPRHVQTGYGDGYREPMEYRGRVVVYQRHPHRTNARGVVYGWAWTCAHPVHVNPVHGGSQLGLNVVIENARRHQWRFHRGSKGDRS